MKSKTTIILVAALLLAIVYAVVRYTDIFKRGTPAAVAGKKLLDLPGKEFGNVENLTIQGTGRGTIVFAKKGDSWELVQPIRAKAEEYKVGELATTLALLKIDHALAPDAKDAQPAITGLDKPPWTLTVTDGKGNTRTLHVGGQPPLAPNRTYVALEGNPKIYVVEADLPSLLDKPLKEYRSRSVLSLPAEEIVRLVVAGHESYTVARDKGVWSATAPLNVPLDAAKVQELLGKIANLSASDFLEDQPKTLATYGLDNPRLTVRVFVQPPAPATTQPASGPASKPAEKSYAVALGNVVQNKVFAKLLDEPAVFQLESSLLEGLQPKLADLRDKQVLNFATALVTGISIRLPEGQATLAQSPQGWQMTAPFAGKANGEAAVALLEAMHQLKADSFRDEPMPPASGLDNPQAKITLTVGEQGKESSVALLIGAATPSGEMTFVKKEPAGSVAVVKTADLKAMLAAPANYWDNKIFSLPLGGRCTAMTLHRPGGTISLLRGEKGTWSMEKPIRSAVDAAAVNKALDLLERVTATKIVSIGNNLSEKYAAAKDPITAELTVETVVAPAPTSLPASAPTSKPASAPASAPATQPTIRTDTFTLHLVQLDNATYAWRDGLPIVAVGELAASAYANLSAEMRDRSVLKIVAPDVDSFTITRGKDTLHLVREKGTWTYPADPYVKIDGEKAAAFLDQFKDVQAEKFASTSSANLATFGLQDPAVVFEYATREGTKKLSLSAAGPQDAKGRYAVAAGVEGIFVVGADLPDKLAKNLKDFKK